MGYFRQREVIFGRPSRGRERMFKKGDKVYARIHKKTHKAVIAYNIVDFAGNYWVYAVNTEERPDVNISVDEENLEFRKD